MWDASRRGVEPVAPPGPLGREAVGADLAPPCTLAEHAMETPKIPERVPVHEPNILGGAAAVVDWPPVDIWPPFLET